MKIKEIQDLIDFISKSGLEEVNIETDQFKIRVKKNSVKTKIIEHPTTQVNLPPASAISPPAQPTEGQKSLEESKKAAKTEKEESSYIPIKSPMIGTFYRSSNPDSDPFIRMGDKVEKGQTVCIIEAMKLFNEIESEVSGTIVKILVENASPVEYDQDLFLVDPA